MVLVGHELEIVCQLPPSSVFGLDLGQREHMGIPSIRHERYVGAPEFIEATYGIRFRSSSSVRP